MSKHEQLGVGPRGVEELSTAMTRRDVDDNKEPFSVDISPEVNDMEIGMDTEEINQQRIYHLRKLFETNPQFRKYAWVPQAVEALLRTTQTDFGNFFGKLDGLEIDPKSQLVRMRVGGVSVEGHEIPIKELASYSLELMADGLDSEQEAPSINYSSEMNSAISTLSDDARYRWDLIARMAAHKSKNKELPLRVSVTTKSSIMEPPSGIGVFMKTGKRRDLFSAMKLSGNNLPMTDRERAIIEHGKAVFKPDSFEGIPKNLIEVVNKLYYDLKELFGIPAGFDFDKGSIKELDGVDEEIFDLFIQLGKLAHDIIDQNKLAYIGTQLIPGAVLKAKATYREEHPFECTGLPREITKPNGQTIDLSAELLKAGNSLRNILTEILNLLDQKGQVLLNRLSGQTDETVRQVYREKEYLIPRTKEYLGEVKQFLSNFKINETRESVRRLTGNPLGEVLKLEE